MLFNKLIPRRKKSSCQQADLLYNFPVLLYIYSGMRMAMMEIRRMLVTVAASFMGMHMGMPAFYRIVMMMRMVFIIMQMSMVMGANAS